MKEQRNPSWKQQVLSKLLSKLEPTTVLRRPFFPDLMRQPDALIVPENGRTVTLNIYGTRAMKWRTALASLEDLFEIKLHVGPQTLAVGMQFGNETDDMPSNDMLRLLENTFDLFLAPDESGTGFANKLLGGSKATVRQTPNLMQVWSFEAEFVQARLRRFDEKHFRQTVQRDRLPSKQGERLLEVVLSKLEAAGIHIRRNPVEPSIKSSIGALEREYKLKFDFELSFGRPALVEVVRASRYGSRDMLRYLMAKARLLRYGLHATNIEPLNRQYTLVALIDGNIAGPDHDPFRYVRALLSAGWEVLSISEAEHLLERI